ncbi:MAG: LysR family transcriptional regulator [Kofleriaceae bacterium]|nr:LysR family transcriptional regulator [Kofleriaceae bacterium]
MKDSIAPADMLLFATVVRDGSFTRAARSAGITKQSASERIGKLERALGVRLLERTTRHLRLTDAGATYYARCAAIATQVDEANQEVQRQLTAPVGLLRVSTPVLYGRRFLGKVTTTYLQRYPQMRVEVVLADRRVNLVEEGFDLAIRIGVLDDSTLAARRLSEGRVYYVASPTFLRAHRGLTAAAVRDVRTIGMSAHESWTLSGKSLKVEPHLVVNDLELACEAAMAGLGIARLPSLVCADALVNRKLQLAFPDATLTSPVHAVYPSRQYMPAKTRAFLELMGELDLSVDLPTGRPPRRAA